jgi:hypothetical protein
MAKDTRRVLVDFIFEHLGEAGPDLQAALLKWKGEFQQVEAEAKA